MTIDRERQKLAGTLAFFVGGFPARILLTIGGGGLVMRIIRTTLAGRVLRPGEWRILMRGPMIEKMMVRGWLAVALLAFSDSARADVFDMGGTISGGTWAGLASLSLVTVGDPGNVPDTVVELDGTRGFGSVPYVYRMGKYDVTLGQYCEFLNAVAATDTYGCYNSLMGGDDGFHPFGISQSGSKGIYTYSVTGANPQAANMPIYCETWFDAVRFCNWLQNGQITGSEGTATTETGAYTLNGDVSAGTEIRNTNALYFLPSENEWYKAAYYKSGGTNAGYWAYPTQSNTAPSNSLALAGTLVNDANYCIGSYPSGCTDPINYLTPVGTFAASPGPYGTYDMGGELWQWVGGTELRGGAYYDPDESMASANRLVLSIQPTDVFDVIGFRVASSEAVPEPGSIALSLAVAVGLLAFAWRKRIRAVA